MTATPASPPTRGWTREVARDGRGDEGFPAHAGMDPPRRSRPWACRGLPRPRGDGPLPRVVLQRPPRASPPTRGWTRPAGRRRIGQLGFPAHAGMDPCPSTRPAARRGLPRPRGDGPPTATSPSTPIVASPPTRGWTPGLCAHPPDWRGFPAHAGMDRRRSRCWMLRPWLPRPRGDGPRPCFQATCRPKASPPTRGWTVGRGQPVGLGGGFPAHAGMDPCRRSAGARWPWLPRPRGDGPASYGLSFSTTRASPPTRGWTLRGHGGVLGLLGFPAHAGMDPWPRSGLAPRPRLPRPRGDGPALHRAPWCNQAASPPTRGWTCRRGCERWVATGFPAHAGMDPCRSSGPNTTHRLPRPRGDGPHSPLSLTGRPSASPPTRGWTPAARAVHRHPGGFPAHAGMDPPPRTPTPTSSRLPRPRGDGPPARP